MGNGYRLDHPRVQEARAKFYRNRARHCHNGHHAKLGFDQLFALVQDESNSISYLARLAGVTPSSMQILYENYFMEFCGNLTASERLARHIQKQRQSRRARSPHQLPDRPWVHALAEQVERAGMSIAPCVNTDERGREYVLLSRMRIDGVECAIHPITGARPRQQSRSIRYRPMRFSRDMLATRVHVCPVLISGWRRCSLVFTSEDMEQLFVPDRDKAYLFIPFVCAPTHKRKRRTSFDPWSYENRWDLITKFAT